MPLSLKSKTSLPPIMARELEQLVASLNALLDVSGLRGDDTLRAGCQIGDIVGTGVATVPSGWLLCDGTVVSREIYVKLFRVVGVRFGVGDGLTTFTLPSLAALAAPVRYIIRAE